jgi:hypothetical protein
MNMAPRAWGGEETTTKVWGGAWVASRVEPERTAGAITPHVSTDGCELLRVTE